MEGGSGIRDSFFPIWYKHDTDFPTLQIFM